MNQNNKKTKSLLLRLQLMKTESMERLLPRIEPFNQTKFVGKRLQMSFVENKTAELWRSFMPRRKEIQAVIGSELYSIEIYPPKFFAHFNPQNEFEKWAAVAVSDFNGMPENMETFIIPGGLYAMFTYKGLASEGAETYHYIHNEWFPKSEYELDNRPHFAVMSDKYKNDSRDSEEELWFPVKRKSEVVEE